MQRVEKMGRRADARDASVGSSTALPAKTSLLTDAAADRATQRLEKDTQTVLPSEQPAAFVPEDIAPSSSSSSAMHCMHCASIGASYIAGSQECIQQQKKTWGATLATVSAATPLLRLALTSDESARRMWMHKRQARPLQTCSDVATCEFTNGDSKQKS